MSGCELIGGHDARDGIWPPGLLSNLSYESDRRQESEGARCSYRHQDCTYQAIGFPTRSSSPRNSTASSAEMVGLSLLAISLKRSSLMAILTAAGRNDYLSCQQYVLLDSVVIP